MLTNSYFWQWAWMDQDVTWYGGGLGPGHIVLDWDLALPQKGHRKIRKRKLKTSGYATWFTARGAIRIAQYDVIDDVITQKL